MVGVGQNEAEQELVSKVSVSSFPIDAVESICGFNNLLNTVINVSKVELVPQQDLTAGTTRVFTVGQCLLLSHRCG